MSPRKRIDKETGLTTDANDADDSRAFEHPQAEEVRQGNVSAAQIGDHANQDPDYPDAIYPPGYIETAATARASQTTTGVESPPAQ